MHQHLNDLRQTVEWTQLTLDRLHKATHQLRDLLPLLSDKATVNPAGGSIWLDSPNREDITLFMQLAPRWEKGKADDGISYSAEVDGVPYRLKALEGALPPTCRLVEEEYLVPEQPAKPARIEKRKVLKCDTVPASEPSEAPVDTGAAVENL